uniref:Uncharacterized protein n=1 Tax=Rhizophora mucronata TaxID=61149 RepID=A0A2P2QQY8_RHIMU
MKFIGCWVGIALKECNIAVRVDNLRFHNKLS